MALSNIFREPRREIVETIVGLITVGAFMYVDYKFSCWNEEFWGYRTFTDGSTLKNFPWGLGMLF